MSELVLEKNFDLPEGWIETTLDEFTYLTFGQSPPSTSYNKKKLGIPFFQGRADFGKMYPQIQTWCNKPNKIAEKNDVLFCVRAGVGGTNLNPMRSGIGRGLAAIRPLCGVNQLYILYFLRSIEPILSQQGQGSTITGITSDYFRQLSIPVAPLNEQKRIVLKIEELFSIINYVEGLSHEISKQIESFMNSLFYNAFSGKLTANWRKHHTRIPTAKEEITKYFKSLNEKYSSQCITAKHQKKKKPKKPMNLTLFDDPVEAQDIPSKWAKTKFVTFCLLQRGFDLPKHKRKLGNYPIASSSGIIDYHNEFKVKGPGVTVGRSGSIGNVVYVLDDYWPLNTSLYVKDFCGNNVKYTYYFLQSFNPKKFGASTSVPTLNRNVFFDIKILVPPYAEQKEIAEIIEKSLTHIEDIRSFISDLNNLNKQISNKILQIAFDGKLVPQDPYDKPASVLLEKIRKEKEQLIQHNPKRRKKNVK